MSDYDNTNRGVLFKNEEKRSERGPDYSGSLNVDGVEFFLDAWIKVAQSGRKFMSVSVKLKDKQASARHAPQRSAPPPKDTRTHGERKRAPFEDMDDVPF